MRDLLQRIGITEFGNYIYEYVPVDIVWWDELAPTKVEIELNKSKTGLDLVSLVFTTEEDSEPSRAEVMSFKLQDGVVTSQTLVAKPVIDNLELDLDLDYSEEDASYVTNSAAETGLVFGKLIGLLSPAAPVNVFEMVDESATGMAEEGETLTHFVAMMSLQQIEYTPDNIKSTIQMGIEFEGDEYLDLLLLDTAHAEGLDFEAEYGVNRQTLQVIIEEIRNFSPV